MKKIKHIIKRIKEGRLKELLEQLAWMGNLCKEILVANCNIYFFNDFWFFA